MDLNRRDLLKLAGAGAAAGIFMTASGKLGAAGSRGGEGAEPAPAPAGEMGSGKTPISLIIDDGSPVDPLFYEIPGYETQFLVPAEFTRRVAETFEKYDLRGKFTVIPMPSCLGRIDRSLKRVPQEHLETFLKLVRERIAPRFDITPEILTHWQSLYTQGTGLGLEGLCALAERIRKVFGAALEWIPCSELARRFVDSVAPRAPRQG